MASEGYEIGYAEHAVKDVKALRAFDQKKILAGVEAHLIHEPTKVSRSRIKAMAQPFWSQYRLRIEDFRVYYDVDEENRQVTILRILEKGTAETPRSQIMKQVEIKPGASLQDVLEQTNGEDVVLTQNGHAVALLTEFDDDDLYWYARERDPAFLDSIACAREEAAQGKTVKHEDLKRQLGME